MLDIVIDKNLIWIFWFGLAVLFFLIELFTVIFITIFFSAGALLACSAALVGISIKIQILLFAFSSITLLMQLRKKLPQFFAQDTKQEDDTDMAINATATVVEPISCTAAGRIKYQGTFWNAEATSSIPKDAVVTIISRKPNDPNTFLVTED